MTTVARITGRALALLLGAAALQGAPPDLYYRAARADGFGNVPYWHQGHDYGYPRAWRRGWVAPSTWESHPYYTPPPNPYVPRTDSDRHTEARRAAGRALELGQFARALAQLRGARNLAIELYGSQSKPTREARTLLWQAEYELWLRGGGQDQRDHSRALASGDLALEAGDLGRAEVGFHDALLRAETREQAATARERLETVRALRLSRIAEAEPATSESSEPEDVPSGS